MKMNVYESGNYAAGSSVYNLQFIQFECSNHNSNAIKPI